jgi:hypothetical protein
MSDIRHKTVKNINPNPEILFETTFRVLKPTPAEIEEAWKKADNLGIPDTLDYLDD